MLDEPRYEGLTQDMQPSPKGGTASWVRSLKPDDSDRSIAPYFRGCDCGSSNCFLRGWYIWSMAHVPEEYSGSISNLGLAFAKTGWIWTCGISFGDVYECPEGHKASIVWISENEKVIAVKCPYDHFVKVEKVAIQTKSRLPLSNLTCWTSLLKVVEQKCQNLEDIGEKHVHSWRRNLGREGNSG